MKFLKHTFFVALSALFLISCSDDDSAEQQTPDNSGSFSINDDTYTVPQAFLIFDGQETQPPYSYQLEFYSDDFVVSASSITGTGDYAFLEFDSDVQFGSQTLSYEIGDGTGSNEFIDVYFLTDYNFETDQGRFVRGTSGSMQVTRINDDNVQINYSFVGDFGETIEGSYRGAITRIDSIDL